MLIPDPGRRAIRWRISAGTGRERRNVSTRSGSIFWGLRCIGDSESVSIDFLDKASRQLDFLGIVTGSPLERSLIAPSSAGDMMLYKSPVAKRASEFACRRAPARTRE